MTTSGASESLATGLTPSSTVRNRVYTPGASGCVFALPTWGAPSPSATGPKRTVWSPVVARLPSTSARRRVCAAPSSFATYETRTTSPRIATMPVVGADRLPVGGALGPGGGGGGPGGLPPPLPPPQPPTPKTTAAHHAKALSAASGREDERVGSVMAA